MEGLPLSHGKNVLLVVVYRFSKYAHFLPLSHPCTAVSVARLFFDNIFKHHGLQETMSATETRYLLVRFAANFFVSVALIMLQFSLSPSVRWSNRGGYRHNYHVPELFLL